MIKFSKEILDMALDRMPYCNQICFLVSGGVDSVAACSYLHNKVFDDNIYSYNNNDYIVLSQHFNHGLRLQNDLMEQNVFDFVEDEDIHFWESVLLEKYTKNNKTEDGCRKARIEWLKNNRDHTIFITAHHLDDATESYMMNVLRGKEGFLPIPFITQVGTNFIVHPFLFTKKKDFIEYVERNIRLKKYIVEDETNFATKGSRRNFIRNEIIPLLQREKMGLDTIVKKKMKERLMLEMIKK